MRKVLRFTGVISLLSVALLGFIYFGVFEKKIDLGDKETCYFYIKSTDGFNDVISNLDSIGLVSSTKFSWLANLRSFGGNNIYPGRYTLKNSMNYSDLVVFLRSGQIDEVEITFNNVRTLSQLAKKVSAQLEITEEEIKKELLNPIKYGYTKETFIASFIPNTYKMYWNTNAEVFVKRMIKEHKKFWNRTRMAKAKKMQLTPVEVSTLASIVQSEQNKHFNEWPVIAGLYYNRLKKRIKLQSDPTVIYAWGDFSIKRVYFKHLKIDSKYNTYKYNGLPPGPIRVPDSRVLDAVLNYKKHNYLFMCANPEFGGKHAFAATNAQHEKNAKKYRDWLNKKKIH
jgi:UPF0755 protein